MKLRTLIGIPVRLEHFRICAALWALMWACSAVAQSSDQSKAPTPRPESFAKQVDLSELGNVAVYTDGRIKSFFSHAQAMMQFVSGPHRINGASPVFMYLDLMLQPERYQAQDIIYVKNPLLREDIIQLFEKTLTEEFPQLIESTTDQMMRSHFENSKKDLEARLTSFRETGLTSPMLLTEPQVQQLLQERSADVLRSAKFVQMIQTALTVADPSALRSNMNVVPPPPLPQEGSEKAAKKIINEPWHSLDDLADHADLYPAGRFPQDLRDKLVSQWHALSEAWTRGDAQAVNAAAHELSTLLPQVNPEIYPSSSKLAWETWYFRSGNMIWIWLFYAAAMVPLLLAVLFGWKPARFIGVMLFLIAFLLHTFAIGLRWYVAQRWPNTNMFEAITTAAWFGGCVSLLLEVFARRSGSRNFFMFGSAVASMTAWMAVKFFPLDLSPNISNAMPVLNDLWLYIHTNVIILSYCLIFIAAVSAFLYLVYRLIAVLRGTTAAREYATVGGAASLMQSEGNTAHRTKPSFGVVLDGTTMVVMELAFILLWAGLCMGAIWADHSWGRPWGWDPKEVFALNTFLIFLLLVHVRLKVHDKGLWTAFLAVVGAGVMIFNWVIINFAISGLHSYA
ncbi:MAG TPA: cytochrome c biogenesis protein CcsA [Phycisphaerales bacterium]|nr:cytochrome c biogenesis protein CcsA [Phycisphaerales bacterium]